MRKTLVVLGILVGSLTGAQAQVSVGIGIGLPGVSIGINLPAYPSLVRVPGYPVYYAPGASQNYFFYDGLYWVYQQDNWYSSSWYNGPWWLVGPDEVPLFILRVPVRYYRQPPPYFRDWRADAPPRWSEHWGQDWEHQHRGWDQWNHRTAPRPAPLPLYQRSYSGNRYPAPAQQQAIQSRDYRYQPRDDVVRKHFQAQREQAGAPGRQPQPPRGVAPRQDPRAQPGRPVAPVPPPAQVHRPQDGAQRPGMPPPATPQGGSPRQAPNRPQPVSPQAQRPDAPHAQPNRQPSPPAAAREQPNNPPRGDGRGQGQGRPDKADKPDQRDPRDQRDQPGGRER